MADNAVEPSKIHQNFADRRLDQVYHLADFYGTVAVNNVGFGPAAPAVLDSAVAFRRGGPESGY